MPERKGRNSLDILNEIIGVVTRDIPKEFRDKQLNESKERYNKFLTFLREINEISIEEIREEGFQLAQESKLEAFVSLRTVEELESLHTELHFLTQQMPAIHHLIVAARDEKLAKMSAANTAKACEN